MAADSEEGGDRLSEVKYIGKYLDMGIKMAVIEVNPHWRWPLGEIPL